MSEIPNDPGLKSVESALGGLSPVPSRLDRDRLMFQAGALARSRTEPTRWTWPSVAALLALALTCESIYLASRPASRVVERLVVIRQPSGAPSTESTSHVVIPAIGQGQAHPRPGPAAPSSRESVSDYQRQQDLVLRFGLDAFPEPVRLSSQSGGPTDGSEDGPMTAGGLRHIELERLTKPGDHS
ncbi:MAG: hypothetical protein ACLQGP_26090 [Isosphaeraceae bacterium]